MQLACQTGFFVIQLVSYVKKGNKCNTLHIKSNNLPTKSDVGIAGVSRTSAGASNVFWCHSLRAWEPAHCPVLRPRFRTTNGQAFMPISNAAWPPNNIL